MSVMQPDPEVYFSEFTPLRDPLLQRIEKEAAAEQIPIVGPVVGRLLYVLTIWGKPGSILELGTATGYSAIWMGRACRSVQGHLTSFENDPGMARRARQHVRSDQLEGVVDIRCEDARDALSKWTMPVDMIFLDIEKQDYIGVLPHCCRLLRAGGLLVADNTGFIDADEFNRSIHADIHWQPVNLWSLLPGHSPRMDGICMAIKN